jgi:hypothetical protein
MKRLLLIVLPISFFVFSCGEVENNIKTDYYESGIKKYEIHYKDGIQNGPFKMWYEDGQKRLDGFWKNGEYDGTWKYYYPSSNTSIQLNYKNSNLNGKYDWWYENGQRKEEGTYKDGKMDGLWTNWSENGQKSGERTYKNGVIVEPLSIVEYDWCYPSCGSDLQSSFKFSSGGTFSFSTIMFGGMSRWGNWEEIDDNTFRLTSTRISSNSSNDQLPEPQIIKLVSDKRLKVGSTVYIR